MVMSIPIIFKSERHASLSGMWSNITETSNGRNLGSSGTTFGGSRSAMVSLLMSLTVMQGFFSVFQRPFLMELCIVVLGCLAQDITWSPNASMIFPHVQRSRCCGQRGSLSLRLSITVNSSFGLRFFGSSLLMSVRDADILGSNKSSNWDRVALSLFACKTMLSRILMRSDATFLISSLHRLVDDFSKKKESRSGTCSLTQIDLKCV